MRVMRQPTLMGKLGISRAGDSSPDMTNQKIQIHKDLDLIGPIWRLVKLKCLGCLQGIVCCNCLELSLLSQEVDCNTVSW